MVEEILPVLQDDDDGDDFPDGGDDDEGEDGDEVPDEDFDENIAA